MKSTTNKYSENKNRSFVTRLTGEDAREFERQIKSGTPNKLAKESLERGSELFKQYQELGYAVIKLNAK